MKTIPNCWSCRHAQPVTENLLCPVKLIPVNGVEAIDCKDFKDSRKTSEVVWEKRYTE